MITTVVNIASAFFLIVGAIFVFISAIGFLRFKDVERRQHCSSLVETGACLSICLGLILQSGFSVNSVKIIILAVFMAYVGVSATHIFMKKYLSRKK